MHSEQINEIATALSKAQGQMLQAPKDRKNPHLGNDYATLDSIIATVRKPLADNGLSFSQMLQANETGLTLETWLLHTSGQFLMSELPLTVMDGNRGVNQMQSLGSSLTYLKRYTLAAMLGVGVGDDDDGNAGEGVNPGKKQQKQQSKSAQQNGNTKQQATMSAAEKKIWDDYTSKTQTGHFTNIFHAWNALGGKPDLSKPDEWPNIVGDMLDYERMKENDATDQEPLFPEDEQQTAYGQD